MCQGRPAPPSAPASWCTSPPPPPVGLGWVGLGWASIEFGASQRKKMMTIATYVS